MKHIKKTVLLLSIMSLPLIASAQNQEKLRVGLMLPYTGAYGGIGKTIDNAVRLSLAEEGNKVGGREIEYFTVDDESDPSKATANINKLIKRDKVDVVIGTVHSGVAAAMVKVAKETNTTLIVPNAGAEIVTGAMCGPNIFRTSFTNWQPGYAMGEVAAKRGHKKVVTITWKYAAGDESVKGFRDGFTKKGGEIVKDLSLTFPNTEFQPFFAEIASLKPDAVYAFFAGPGAVKFVKDYAASGLKKSIPLYGPGFLTDGTLEGQGADADGLLTTLHYADDLNNKKDKDFRLAYVKAYKMQPDVYAVQGYDAGKLLAVGGNATKGDLSKKEEFAKAVRANKFDSPRGKFTLSPSHNPVQDIYLRKVVGKENTYVNVASPSLADPAIGCKM